MKKSTVYLLCTMKATKEKLVEETQGYILDLTNKYGFTVKIALHYKRPFWNATLYEYGISCTLPNRYSPDEKGWKKKEDLIEALKKLDFEFYLKRGKEYYTQYKQIIDEYKEKKANER